MRVNSIQVLRAVAAFLVVYEHSMDLQISFSKSAQQSFFHLNNFGCIGVDLFFVISGFIITYVASQYIGVKQGMIFIKKRFLRINPIYYLTTIALLIIMIFQGIIIGKSLRANQVIISLSDSLLILPTSGDVSLYSPLLIVGWTLSFEWLFYILFFIPIAVGKLKKILLPAIIVALILLGLLMRPDDLRLIFLTNPIMLEFLLGVTICWISFKVRTLPASIGLICLFTGISICLALIFLGYGEIWHYKQVLNGHSSFRRFLIWGIPSSLIVAGCVFLEKSNNLSKIWDNKFLLLIGDASYSIYLVHVPVLLMFHILYSKVGFFIPPDASIPIHTAISLLSGILLFKTIENPILKSIKKQKSDISPQPLVQSVAT